MLFSINTRQHLGAVILNIPLRSPEQVVGGDQNKGEEFQVVKEGAFIFFCDVIKNALGSGGV